MSEPSLRAYVAWVAILQDDTGPPDVKTQSVVHDERASHFWDEQHELPPMFASLLKLPEGWPAWDIYLAYPAGATWHDTPPMPAFWHHQLGDLDIAPKLDGVAFEKQLRELMAR